MTNVTIRTTLAHERCLLHRRSGRPTWMANSSRWKSTLEAGRPSDDLNTMVSTRCDFSADYEYGVRRSRGVGRYMAATVNVGPAGVTGLPRRTLCVVNGGQRIDGLFGALFAGALMLMLSAQVSNRRMLVAVMFVLVALVVVAAGLALLLTRDDDEVAPSREPASAPESTAAPDEQPAAEEDGPLVFDFPPTPTPYVLPEPAGARTLMIPKLADQFRGPIPIVEIPFEDRQWDVSGLGTYIGWLEGTTWLAPGWGNTVLAAHVQLGFENPGPFWGLGELEAGDEIIVGEGSELLRVTSTRKVDPTDLTVTAPTNGPTLTLITCTDWNNARGVFAQRLVVQAVPAQS